MLFCNRKIIFDHFCYRYGSACMLQNTSFMFINTKSCSKIWLCLRNRENDKGLYATMRGGRIDPSSCLDTCWVDDMAVWWFRATCFHGLKYLCVNREVLKQNFIMKTEMKASNECLYPTDVFLISCGMGCKRITVSDIAYIEAMKDNCIIHMVDGKRYTQSCPMGDIEPELNPLMHKVAFPHCYLFCIGNCGSRFSN